jgi:hypothetical protein
VNGPISSLEMGMFYACFRRRYTTLLVAKRHFLSFLVFGNSCIDLSERLLIRDIPNEIASYSVAFKKYIILKSLLKLGVRIST